MKKSLVFLVTVGILLGIILFLVSRLKSTQEEYEVSMANNKVYMDLFDDRDSQVGVLSLDNSTLAIMNDSISRQLKQVRDSLNIAEKKVKNYSYIKTVYEVHDTLRFKDTILVDNVCLDTFIRTPFYELNLGLKYPNEISIEPRFTSEKFIITSVKRETIKPASKVFFIRWFQRKHNVLIVDVVDKNPYVVGSENRFIRVIE